MATTYFHQRVAKSGGRQAGQRIAYLTRRERSGVGLADREDLIRWGVANLPTWATDAAQYFRAAERYERVGGVAYTEWRFALPRELSRQEQHAAVREVLGAAFGERHPYLWAVHDPAAADGGRQPHVHVLWSARTLDAIARPEAQFFRRYNAAAPAHGGARKDPGLNHRGAVQAARVLYTDVMNLALERGGHAARLHPARLAARGIARPPEPHVYPSDTARRKAGDITPRMAAVLAHKVAHADQRGREAVQAQAYWEARKAEVGITPDLSQAARLARVLAARQARVTQGPPQTRAVAAELRLQARTVQAEVQRLTQGREQGAAQGRSGLRARVFAQEGWREEQGWARHP